MHANLSSDDQTLLALAAARGWITPDEARQLDADSQQSGFPPTRLAVEQGLLLPVQLDVLEALAHPNEVSPGFEIIDVLGYGGLGVVYRARQVNLDRAVALKTIQLSRMDQPGILARFQQEAKTLASLRHPNIVAAYDYGAYAGRLWFAMEIVDGEDLDCWLRRSGRLDERTAWAIVRQVASGLAHAAKSGIVHRDVKPANLLLTDPPTGFNLPAGVPLVKITDFGLALLAGGGDSRTRLTVAGAALGTPQYMAPEQLRESTVDLRADIYALGATAYQMLAGALPFGGETTGQVLSQKLLGQVRPLAETAPGVSRASVELVAAMMAHDPAARIADYQTLFARLDALKPLFDNNALSTHDPNAQTLVAGAGVSAAVPQSSTAGGALTNADTLVDLRRAASPPAAGRARRRFAALGALLLLTAAAGWWLLGRNRDPVVDGPLLKPTGWEQPLYDGQSLAGWTPRPGGFWKQASDAEGGAVLSGDGGIVRRLPWPRRLAPEESANYRLHLGVDLQQAAAIEVHFGVALPGGRDVPRHVLRLSRDAISLGSKATERGALTPAADPVSRDEASTSDDPHYDSVRLERHGGFWLAMVNQRRIGVLPVGNATEGMELVLYVERGPALFENLSISELR